jgi:predicted nuclease with TOPRIM domain
VTKERRIKMYRGYDSECGLPPRIYRSPDDVRRDIAEVRRSIDRINSRLNIRGLLLEFIADDKDISPKEVVSTLETLLSEAENALLKLKELRVELSLLEEELYEIKCEMQI